MLQFSKNSVYWFHFFSVIVRFMSYLKCSNWHQISKLASSFGYLYTFCYSARENLLKTKNRLVTYKLATGQSISYKYVNQL